MVSYLLSHITLWCKHGGGGQVHSLEKVLVTLNLLSSIINTLRPTPKKAKRLYKNFTSRTGIESLLSMRYPLLLFCDFIFTILFSPMHNATGAFLI